MVVGHSFCFSVCLWLQSWYNCKCKRKKKSRREEIDCIL